MDAVCRGSASVTDVGTVSSPAITEASGLASSWLDDDTWWITNDSGDSARIFAVDGRGQLIATVRLVGAEARDWESLAIGPPVHGSSPSVYVGDTGNNQVLSNPSKARDTLRVYRFPEPVLRSGGDPQVLSVRVETLRFRFPDGPHDVEAMIVDPDSGDLLFVTKDWSFSGVAGLYRAPAGFIGSSPSGAGRLQAPSDGTSHGSASVGSGAPVVLEQIGQVALGVGVLVTDADVSRDGSVVALRSYGAVDLYRRVEGQPVWSAFTSRPCAGPPIAERQGESIGFAPDGGSYLTVSEGEHPVLHRTAP